MIPPVILEGTVEWCFASRDANNIPIVADATVTYQVYADGVAMGGISGVAAALDSPTLTGAYRIAFVAAAASGFARGSKYTIIARWEVDGGDDRMEIEQFLVT